MSYTQKYSYAKGRAFLAEKDATTGQAKVLQWIGNSPSCELALEIDNLTHTEDYTGQNLEDVRLVTAKRCNLTARLENFDLDMLALGLYGNKVSVTGSTVTAEALPSSLAVGDEVRTKYPKISSLVVKDSAGTPATLVADTDYTILDATTGRIKILNLGSYTQPFKVDYSYASRKDLGMFLNTPPIRWFTFEGINLVTNTKQIVDLYKVSLDPLSGLQIIGSGNTVAGYDLKGSALLEDLISSTDVLGQFGRIRDLA
jgi:hypothetical protein